MAAVSIRNGKRAGKSGASGKSEYEKYHASPRMKKERALRNKNRREAMAAGKVRKGDGREVDHKNGNAQDNRPSNLRVISRHANRVKQ